MRKLSLFLFSEVSQASRTSWGWAAPRLGGGLQLCFVPTLKVASAARSLLAGAHAAGCASQRPPPPSNRRCTLLLLLPSFAACPSSLHINGVPALPPDPAACTPTACLHSAPALCPPQPGHQCVHDQGESGGGTHHRLCRQVRHSLAASVLGVFCSGEEGRAAARCGGWCAMLFWRTLQCTASPGSHVGALPMLPLLSCCQVVPRPLAARPPHRDHALPSRGGLRRRAAVLRSCWRTGSRPQAEQCRGGAHPSLLCRACRGLCCPRAPSSGCRCLQAGAAARLSALYVLFINYVDQLNLFND